MSVVTLFKTNLRVHKTLILNQKKGHPLNLGSIFVEGEDVNRNQREEKTELERNSDVCETDREDNAVL